MYKHYTRKVYIKEIQEDVRLIMHTKIYFYIIILFFFSFYLSGCDYRNYIYTEDSLKRVAEKSLEDKYDEKFVIHRAWDKNQTMFFADCSPKDNPDVIFRCDIYKNGNGIIDDGYLQGLIAQEINDILINDFKKMFGNCYTRPFIMNYYNVPAFENVKEVTLREYAEEAGLSVNDVGYNVYVDVSEISNESIDEECSYFEKKIPDMIKKQLIPDLRVHIYFTTSDLIMKCKNYYNTHWDSDFDLDNELDKYSNISLVYENGKLEKIYEGRAFNEKYVDYKIFRKKIDMVESREDN